MWKQHTGVEETVRVIKNRTKLASLWIGSALLVITLAAVGIRQESPVAHAATGSISKVMWIMEENRSEPQVMTGTDNPYAQSLAHTYGLAANMHNETDPSAGNYFALLSGNTYGVADDGPPSQHILHGHTIFSQLPAGQAMAFSETMPSNCDTSDGPKTDVNRAGTYAVHHSGWPYFVDEAALCQKYQVNLQNNFQNYITNGLPTFTQVAPANCNEMHHGTLPASSDICQFDSVTGPNLYTRADWWLKTWIPKIMAGPDWQSGKLAIFITWDEGAGPGDTAGMDCTTSTIEACHPTLIVMSPYTKGITSNTYYNHYYLLRTTEELLGISTYLGKASTAKSMAADFNLTAACSTCTTDQKPTVTLSSPAATATVAPGATVTIAGSATDDKGVSKVDIKVDGTLLKSFTTASFSTTWTAPTTAGTHTITATATDTASQTATDTSTVTVSSPGGNPCTLPATDYGIVTLSASVATTGTYRIWSRMAAADTTNNTYLLEIDGNSCYKVGGSSVPVYTAGAATHFTSNSANWMSKTTGGTLMDVSLTSGTHSLKLIGNGDGVALDRLLLTQDTACVPSGTGDNCTTSVDNTSPVVSITAPPAGTNVTATTNVRAQATDDTAVTKVEFYVDGSLKATDTVVNAGGYYTYALDPTTFADGTHTLTAKAYDGAGNSALSAAVQITTGTVTPPPTLTGDINGDNKVDFLDFSVLASKYGQTGTNLGGADLNNDGKVDFLDVSILAANYGK